MRLQEQLAFCKQCEKRSFDSSTGIFCSVTQQKPNFIDNCSDFAQDEKQLKKSERMEVQKSNKAQVAIAIGVIFIVLRIILRILRD
ncbi:hypothetical protein HX109_05220 [Galbibacter sp. BG1]|uniref:hypothetical protein n=1 Tax=Galbibacter sp. BG1 TaxID=1170699 RepID=UPI0015BA1CA1|nr:hypothetical protein [Galbibacter sp. BG1]QLE00994.1 hypothetical protein HX109_05220 [Galbibacter sp. BG1]